MSQRIIDRSYVGEVLQHLYASDLDMRITLLSQTGYFYSSSKDKRTPLKGSSIEGAVTNLAFLLSKEFPASGFASWWSNNLREEDFR